MLSLRYIDAFDILRQMMLPPPLLLRRRYADTGLLLIAIIDIT